MSEIINIFSNEKIEKEGTQNLKIIADRREKNSLVISELVHSGVNVNFEQLEVADFLVNNVAIERKSLVSDTPVIIRENKHILLIPIKEAFKRYKKNKEIEVMGVDFVNKNTGWFKVYGVTKHKSEDVYGLSTSPFVKRKIKNETNFTAKITGGHNVYLLRNKKVLCLPTSQVKIGDYLLIVPPKLEEEKPIPQKLNKFLDYVQQNSTKGYTLSKNCFRLNSSSTKYKNICFNKDFFFMIGLWTAEGHYNSKGLAISQKSPVRNKIIEVCLKKVFGNFSFNKDTYWVGGKAYFKLFKDILKLETGSANKQIPSIVFNAETSLKAEFVKGYFFGDGYVNQNKDRRNPQLMAVSKSRNLTCGLSYLLYSMGIKNSVNEEYKTYNGKRMKYYLIRVKTGDLNKFIETIGQIPTKEMNISPSISTDIPFYAHSHFYRPLLKLKKEELVFLFKAVEKLRELQKYNQRYIEKIIDFAKTNSPKTDFSRKIGICYGTLRDITNKYVKKSPHHFMKIVKYIRSREGLNPVNINLRMFKRLLNKIHINTYLNSYHAITPKVIDNVLQKVDQRTGLETLFLLTKIHQKEIFLERIYNIEKINGKFEVYDFSVEKSENFVGGNIPILLHNTVSDFISSMISKRLSQQLMNMQQYESKLLLIEGIDEQHLYNDNEPGINPNAIRGFLLDVILKYKVPIIFTKDYKDTAKFLLVLAKKPSEVSESLRAKRVSKSSDEQKQFILEGFPGIGAKTAKKLLKEYGNIKNIINSTEDELNHSIGKKSESFSKLLE